MARNKHPEETVEKILAVSAKLFMEKGYEHTTLQDIIDNLGGLTKGAIYHHFKGKEEILLAIADRMGEQTEAWMRTVRDDPGLTGAEKLQKMFRASLENSDQTDLFVLAPNMLKNPKLMSILLESMIGEVLPNYMEPVLREAVADGSIRTDYPEELGSCCFSSSNVWLNPHDLPCHAGEDPPPHGAIRPDAAEHGPGPAGSGAVESVGAILPPVPGTAVNNRRNCPTGQLLFHINTYQPNV
ncbi:MAG: TetR/AcrR family transcriptional regulator [Dysosmobacter welbionis]|uniref:TetR/AcrR family transcriptional regulator n=1 Tax=Dysosmobacter welbionis TaxID=2093857 RepID=UPI003993BE39